MHVLARVIVCVSCLVGCGSKAAEDPGPSCAQVMDHILEVTKQQLVGHGDMQLGQRDAMIKQCEERKMPVKTRTCLLAAKTLADIAECRAGKPSGGPPQRKPETPRSGSSS
jgi:hypothetical protein